MEVSPHCQQCPTFFFKFESCPLHLFGLPEPSQNPEMLVLALDLIFVIASLIPYFAGFLISALTIALRTEYIVSQAVIILLQQIIGNGIKHSIKEQRPQGKPSLQGSCSINKSFGMPSNHAAFSVSISLWYLISRRIRKSNPCPNRDRISNVFKIAENVFIAITPVILVSRVSLKYHTTNQIVAGSFLGSFITLTYYFFIGRNILGKKDKNDSLKKAS